MDVKRRVVVSVSAWLAGATVATSGTLVAISWIGQGISTSSVDTLSVDQVSNALAAMSPSPDDTTADTAGSTATPSSLSPSPSAPSSPTLSAPYSATATATAVATISAPRTLGSAGGSVIAVCTTAGAYLTSWSPAENFQVGGVRRGPARVARVEFESGPTEVELSVYCHDGVPTTLPSGTQPTGTDN